MRNTSFEIVAVCCVCLCCWISGTPRSAHGQELESFPVGGSLLTPLAPLVDSPRDPDSAVNYYGLHNANAADSTNANLIRPDSIGGETETKIAGVNVTGNGVVVGLWDGGDILTTHENFRAGIITDGDGASSFSDHANHVLGTILGTGAAQAGATVPTPQARGMASNSTGTLGPTAIANDFASDTAEMIVQVPGSNIDISNHSYGFVRGWDATGALRSVGFGVGNSCLFAGIGGQGREHWFGVYDVNANEDVNFGRYTSTSASIDGTASSNDTWLPLFSAGNDRNDAFVNVAGTGQFAAFFNADPGPDVCQVTGAPGGPGFYVVSTGNFAAPPGDGNSGTGYDSLSNGGQTAKNTLVVGAMNDVLGPHNGATMTTASFSSYGGTDDGRIVPHVVGNGVGLTSSVSTSDTAYASFNGTSMSTPNVSGTAALLLEHWRNSGLNAPKAATQKGTLIHTATDVTNNAFATAGPDYATGYGHVDAVAAADFITDSQSVLPTIHHLIESSLSAGTGDSDTHNFTAMGGDVKATLVWTDPAGSSGAGNDSPTPVLVNNLDLIIMAGATTYHPWSLDVNNPANAATRTGANNVDNVEQVLIETSFSTPLSGGTPFSVIVSHQGVLATGQNYSLLVTTAVPEPSAVIFLSFVGICIAGRAYWQHACCRPA